MADARISELAFIDTVVTSEDLLVIVDFDALITKKILVESLFEADSRRPTSTEKAALTGSAFGDPPSAENPFITTVDDRVGGREWTSVAHADLTFTANSGGTWTVASGDLAYYKWIRLNSTTVAMKGAIVASTTSGAGTELRVSIPAGITFGSNDSFGFTVWSVDGFANQDVGQSIGRVSTNALTFKNRTGTAWGSATDLVAVIWNLVIECTVVPDPTEG
jgi:hypothetical protein